MRADMIGAVLIGGQSRRMRFPKHLLPWQGRPLGLHLCERLDQTLGEKPVLVGDGPRPADTEQITRIDDWIANVGPAGGIVAALDYAGDQDVLVLAADLPLMTGEALHWIIAQSAKTQKNAIWPRLNRRPFGEPLAAIYRQAIHNTMKQAIHRGHRRMTDIVPAAFRAEPTVPEPLEAAFTNINTPKDWAVLTGDCASHKDAGSG